MSSEPKPQPSPGPRPGPRKAGDPGPARPDPAGYSVGGEGASGRYGAGGGDGAAELARALGYDPDDPATWPGAQPSPSAVGTAPAASAPAAGGQAGPAPFKLTDPTTMRALAHPVRMALLELFAVHDTLTATQASEALGESPANCAFHLRTLAKYGLVEEAGGGRGRERPWRARHKTISIPSTGLEGPQAKLAASALGRAFVDRWLGSIRSTLMADAWPPEWEEAVTAHHSLVFLTPDEAVQVAEEVSAVLGRYLHRRGDPAARPAGSLPVEYSVFGYPRQDLSAPLPGDRDAAGEPGPPGRPDGPARPATPQ